MKDEEIQNVSSSRVLGFLIGTIIMSLFSIKVYGLIRNPSLDKYWVVIPLGLLLITYTAQVLFKKTIISRFSLFMSTIASTIIMGLVSKITIVNNIFLKYEELLIVGLFFISLISLAANSSNNKEISLNTQEEKDELFNLFYINTSKVHEIAMLIDNKIMKTVEREQSSQELLKSNLSIDFKKSGLGGTSLNQVTENSSKKSVYESFDVKTTKSIMLRKIYSSIKDNDSNSKELGRILLLKNVELKQRNTEDTVMVLNVLKDGDMKQFSEDDNFEINFSKMMEEMLDDFTIDYAFNHNNDNYLIRIPYKSKEYFENSYSHNDLQLGKLSIIGIYRGEIDFSEIDSISSKFLEIFSESYKDQLKRNNDRIGDLLPSAQEKSGEEYQFKVEHKRLNGTHHLIDLIAIIQEINIKDGELSG